MKPKSSLIAAVALVLLTQAGTAMAAAPRAHGKKTSPPKKHAAAPRRAQGPTPCQTVSISPREDREIVILKMTQRMDCLENKVNYLSEQLSVRSNGAVPSFVEKPKEFVIRYPRDPENP